MRKRTITLAGHQTSLALEPEFWDALEHIASELALSWPELVAQIDEIRENTNLASAVRVAILNHVQQNQKS